MPAIIISSCVLVTFTISWHLCYLLHSKWSHVIQWECPKFHFKLICLCSRHNYHPLSQRSRDFNISGSVWILTWEHRIGFTPNCSSSSSFSWLFLFQQPTSLTLFKPSLNQSFFFLSKPTKNNNSNKNKKNHTPRPIPSLSCFFLGIFVISRNNFFLHLFSSSPPQLCTWSCSYHAHQHPNQLSFQFSCPWILDGIWTVTLLK